MLYKHFTDRARKVMKLASDHARASKYEFIATEHVLIGLVKDGGGVAANVLHNLGLTHQVIEAEVAKAICAPLFLDENGWIGKLPPTPAVVQAVEFARDEARNLKHNYVGTEHLLLGLMREQDGMAAQVLTSLGVRLEAVREMVQDLLSMAVAPPVEKMNAEANEPALSEGIHCDLPEYARRIVISFDQEIELLNEQKEEAIAEQDFENACMLRDQCQHLKVLRDEFLSNWPRPDAK